MTTQARRGTLVLSLLPSLSLLLMACPGPAASSGEAKAKSDAKTSAAGHDGGASTRNGRPSLPALGEAIVTALNAKDARALAALSMSEAEYKRQFTAVETEPSVLDQGPEQGFAMHDRINRQALVTMMSNHGGKGYAFVRLESSGHEAQPGWVIHRRPRLVVRNAEGEELLLSIVGVMLEHPASQTFSILSFLP